MQRKRQVTSARQAAISPLVRLDRDQGIEKNYRHRIIFVKGA
jgi:hypothetical protein